jgi:predicted Abi (CAAX) family protease
MINYKFIGIAIILLLFAIFHIIKNKFYKRKERDMLWATGSNVFFSDIVLIIFALFIIYYELSKLF